MTKYEVCISMYDSITATGLAAGDYYVTITDANGCVTSSGTNTINPSAPIPSVLLHNLIANEE